MADPIELHVVGLKEFRAQLKEIDKALPRMLRVAHNEAAELVVVPAKRAVPSRSGKAAKSVRAGSTQTRTRVKGGSKRVPYYPWLDFGGKAGDVRRQYRKRGRYIYRQYFKLRDSGRFAEVMEESLQDVARKAGLHIDG